MSAATDVLIVGSGPAGAMAAAALVARGLSVHLIHMGYDDATFRDRIPDQPFEQIRASDPQQAYYFLGPQGEGVPTGQVRIGSQLTPPRQFVTRNAETYLPTSGASFEPMQSLASGGLGAAWGAAAYTYSDDELQRMGVEAPEFARYYQEVADQIGVSGSLDDATGRDCAGQLQRIQPALPLDSNAQALLAAHDRRGSRPLRLGRIPLAILSQDLGERRANPQFDMDFWSDSRKSIYRPRYTLDDLAKQPNFQCTAGVLATGFDETADGVVLRAIRPDAGAAPVEFAARKLVLCAGALNSARLVLAARGQAGVRVPLLCNPYTYMPCLQVRRLGQPAREARHSMAQLAGMYAPEDAPNELVSLQLYSYRSLLNFKLVKELPLHPWAGLQVVRLLMNSLMIVGVHHADAPSADNWLTVRPGAAAWPLELNYQPTAELLAQRSRREIAVLRELLVLGCVGGARLRPGHASSIHYAGTVPHLPAGPADRHGLDDTGRLLGSRSVYVADSAGWRYLPAKGLTLTIMANARRIADHVARDLQVAA